MAKKGSRRTQKSKSTRSTTTRAVTANGAAASGSSRPERNVQSVMDRLAEWGTESGRRINARQGAGADQFGVALRDLRGLAKKLKRDHALACELWATGNFDARVLAAMLFDPGELDAEQAEAMVRSVSSYKLVDELVFGTIAKTPYAEALRPGWMAAPEEFVGRAGWNLLIARLAAKDVERIDLRGVLRTIEAEILSAPYHKQEAMNRALVEIGTRVADLTEACVAIGHRLGRFDPRPVEKGRVSTFAPEWIESVLARRR